HERIVTVLEARVGVVVGKIHARVAVDHIDDDGDAVLVAHVDKRLEIRALAEAFVHTKVSDGEITPVNRAPDIRQRHDLEPMYAEIFQVSDDVTHALEIAAELGNVD